MPLRWVALMELLIGLIAAIMYKNKSGKQIQNKGPAPIGLPVMIALGSG